MAILTISVDVAADQLTKLKTAIRQVKKMSQDPTNSQIEAELLEICKRECRAIVYQAGREVAEAALVQLSI